LTKNNLIWFSLKKKMADIVGLVNNDFNGNFM